MKLLQKIIIILVLGFLVTSAFFMRFYAFKTSSLLSIDEVVYYRLAKQIYHEFPSYNIIEYGNELSAQGRELPDYFFKPLFKYPPVYAGLMAASFHFFGERGLGVIMPSLLAGVLMIVFVYLLASRIFNPFIGLIAAFIFSWEPLTWACAQKVWLDATLAFFMLASVYYFNNAISAKHRFNFLLSGFFCGMALLTKYPGGILIGVYLLYAVLVDRALFRKPYFYFCLALPFLMLIPWILWNFQIYGASLDSFQITTHASGGHMRNIAVKATALLIMASALFLLRNRIKDYYRKSITNPGRLLKVSMMAFFIMLLPYIFKSMQPNYIPRTGWRMSMFINDPIIFYIGQLIEFSLFNVFAFVGLFLSWKDNEKSVNFLKITLGVILVFYMAWGNYQSRYILSAVPILTILSAAVIDRLFRASLTSHERLKRFLRGLTFSTFLFYIAVKVVYIDLTLIWGNDYCYF